MQVTSPINPNTPLQPFLECKDYTVSRETFNLLLDSKSEILITSPQPKESELAKYYQSEDYISHTDSKKGLIDKVYQIAKKYAINKKVKLVKGLLQGDNKKLLDIGCGTGDFLNACTKNGFQVNGVEPNQNAKNLALKKNRDVSIASSVYDVNQKFDVITMWHVLEHVPNLDKYVMHLKSLLNDNGVLVIAVPNYKSYDANHYKEFWAAYDVPRHLWHFSKKSIKQLFDKVNMHAKKILPMKLDSFYVSLLSEKYKTGKSNLIKAFYIGFLSNLKAKRSKEYSSHIYILKNR